ncbi:MAG: hypothetical protein ACYDG2_22965, partial [Ruminiclostridium sp.]
MFSEFIFDARYQGISLFILGSIITFILTYVSIKYSLKNSMLTFESSSDLLIDRNNLIISNDLNVTYKDMQIDKLVRTIIYFWNNGNKAIRKEDLVNDNILRINIDDNMQVYSCNILKNTDDSNGFEAKINDNKIIFGFNYLEPRNGIKLELFHDNELFDPKIIGKVIDLKGDITNSKKRINSKMNFIFDQFG